MAKTKSAESFVYAVTKASQLRLLVDGVNGPDVLHLVSSRGQGGTYDPDTCDVVQTDKPIRASRGGFTITVDPTHIARAQKVSIHMQEVE